MASNYSGAPEDTDEKLELVRMIIGDTDNDNLILTDQEICQILDIQPIVSYAAATACQIIAGRYAQRGKVKIGKTEVDFGQKAKQYMDFCKMLRQGGAGDLPGGDGTGVATVGMFVGGTSKQEAKSLHSDKDKITESFAVGQDDYPTSRVRNETDRDDC